MSVYNFAFRGGMPMGNLLSGWLVPVFTAPVVLGVNGFVLILLALYFCLYNAAWLRCEGERENLVRPERFELEAFCGRERSGSPLPKS